MAAQGQRFGRDAFLSVRDAGSGVDVQSLYGIVDGGFGSVVYNPRTAVARLSFGTLKPGRHRLAFGASDWQETRNHENVYRILPNTRTLRAGFRVR